MPAKSRPICGSNRERYNRAADHVAVVRRMYDLLCKVGFQNDEFAFTGWQTNAIHLLVRDVHDPRLKKLPATFCKRRVIVRAYK